MMSEPVLVYCRQWPMTTALAALLAPEYCVPVIPLYTKADLVLCLQKNRYSPVVLGLSPHEHVAELYRLQPLLSGRSVLFVAYRFYWTDYRLPAFCGMQSYQCCTLDALCAPFTRRREIRRFRRLTKADVPVSVMPVLATEQILSAANGWLYGQMKASGMSMYEYVILQLLSENQRGGFSSRVLSHYKNSGLSKLGMTRHVSNLFRGVKVRPILQARLP